MSAWGWGRQAHTMWAAAPHARPPTLHAHTKYKITPHLPEEIDAPSTTVECNGRVRSCARTHDPAKPVAGEEVRSAAKGVRIPVTKQRAAWTPEIAAGEPFWKIIFIFKIIALTLLGIQLYSYDVVTKIKLTGHRRCAWERASCLSHRYTSSDHPAFRSQYIYWITVLK